MEKGETSARFLELVQVQAAIAARYAADRESSSPAAFIAAFLTNGRETVARMTCPRRRPQAQPRNCDQQSQWDLEQHTDGRVRAPRASGDPLTSRSIFGDHGRARDAGFPGGNPIDQL